MGNETSTEGDFNDTAILIDDGVDPEAPMYWKGTMYAHKCIGPYTTFSLMLQNPLGKCTGRSESCNENDSPDKKALNMPIAWIDTPTWNDAAKTGDSNNMITLSQNPLMTVHYLQTPERVVLGGDGIYYGEFKVYSPNSYCAKNTPALYWTTLQKGQCTNTGTEYVSRLMNADDPYKNLRTLSTESDWIKVAYLTPMKWEGATNHGSAPRTTSIGSIKPDDKPIAVWNQGVGEVWAKWVDTSEVCKPKWVEVQNHGCKYF